MDATALLECLVPAQVSLLEIGTSALKKDTSLLTCLFVVIQKGKRPLGGHIKSPLWDRKTWRGCSQSIAGFAPDGWVDTKAVSKPFPISFSFPFRLFCLSHCLSFCPVSDSPVIPKGYVSSRNHKDHFQVKGRLQTVFSPNDYRTGASEVCGCSLAQFPVWQRAQCIWNSPTHNTLSTQK